MSEPNARPGFRVQADVVHAIWWTSSEDCHQLGAEPEWPDTVPEYVRREYVSRYGRNGRGRLWTPYEVGTDGWPDRPETRAAEDCGGIVMLAEHAPSVACLPGFLTTMAMRWLELHNALLITCRTPDDLRAAIKAGTVAFTFCEIPTETPNARN